MRIENVLWVMVKIGATIVNENGERRDGRKQVGGCGREENVERRRQLRCVLR